MDIKKALLRVAAISAVALSLQVGCIKAVQTQDAPQGAASPIAFKVPPPDMQQYFDTTRPCAPASAPQPASPVLNSSGQDIPGVYLQSLDVSVEVTGNIATTRFVLVFRNSAKRYFGGFLTFPLPDGRSVTHYALDVDGHMREAVPVPKAVATRVFEEIDLPELSRPVDPWLFERVEGNNFRTRIPFLGSEFRTISIGYEEELPLVDGHLRYRLPLGYPAPIEKFAVTATVFGGGMKPVVSEPAKGEEEIRFDKVGGNYVATIARDNYQPSREITFALPVPVDTPVVVMQPAQGGYYFLASVAPAPLEPRKKRYGDTLAIIWDVSLSGLQRQRQREMEMLDVLFADKKDATVHLYFLNNRLKKISADGGYSVVGGDFGGLKAALESAIFDGGTDFSQINLSDIAGDEILFFSDGISTLSDANVLQIGDLKRPIHCVVSSPKADYGVMRRLAGRTGGKFVDINALSSEKLRSELLNETLQFLGVEHGKSISEVYPSIATPLLGSFSVAGISSAGDAELTLLFGFGHTVEKKVGVKLSAADTVSQGLGSVGKVWAQKKIAMLDLVDYEKNRIEITELGSRFGIVTRGTSLVVLRSLDDYYRNSVTPPKEFGTEILADTATFFADTTTLAGKRLAELWRAVSGEEEDVVWVSPINKQLDTLNTAEFSTELWRATAEGEDEGTVWERAIKHQDALNRAKKRRDREEWERKLKHLKELDRVRKQHKRALNRVANSREVESGMLDDAVTSVAPQVREWWDTDVAKVKEHRMVIAKEDSTEEKIKIYKNEIREADEEPFVRVWRGDPLTVTAVRKNHYKVETVLPTTVEHPIKNDERKPYYSTVEGFVRKRDVRKLSASEVAAVVAARSVSDYTSTRGIPDPIFWKCGCDGDKRKPASTATVADWGEFTGAGTGTAANGDNSRRCHGEGAKTHKLTGNAEADYLTYLKLREYHAASPTFYFDMAGWFYAHGDKETGLRILTSIAELEQESAPLYRMLGYRLKEYGELAYLKFVYEKVMEWRPMDPQSYRDYALALFDNGYEQAALDSLYALLERPFPEINHVRYLGVAEAVIAEINRLITKNPYLKTSKIDERLIKSAPVDLRVVINWNRNDTDIDLHVVDPRGETYNHINRRVKRPWLGGRIGLDNRDGYGPEQFMLKKAVRGKYRIYASYNWAEQFASEDPVTVMAEIFTKYGDSEAERRQVVCLHLAERTGWDRNDVGKVLLAEFEL